jgi:hypothetical protein
MSASGLRSDSPAHADRCAEVPAASTTTISARSGPCKSPIAASQPSSMTIIAPASGVSSPARRSPSRFARPVCWSRWLASRSACSRLRRLLTSRTWTTKVRPGSAGSPLLVVHSVSRRRPKPSRRRTGNWWDRAGPCARSGKHAPRRPGRDARERTPYGRERRDRTARTAGPRPATARSASRIIATSAEPNTRLRSRLPRTAWGRGRSDAPYRPTNDSARRSPRRMRFLRPRHNGCE